MRAFSGLRLGLLVRYPRILPRCHSRENARLSGINVIPAKAGIHNPVSDGIMDPRIREDDNKSVLRI